MGIIGNKCEYCNKNISKEALFCPHCGKEQIKFSKKLKTNKQESGYTCPHCGGDFKVFSCLCPHCGKEQIGQIRSKSILQFTQELQRLDDKKSKSGVAAFINSKKIKNLEEQKLNYIRTYVVPNSKEDVLEFMVLASSNFNPYMMMAKNCNEVDLKEKEFQKQKLISNAWHAKMEQVYQKAQAAFGQDEDFIVIKQIFEEKENIINRLREKQKREEKNRKLIFGGVAVAWVVAFVMLAIFGNHNSDAVDTTKAQIDVQEINEINVDEDIEVNVEDIDYRTMLPKENLDEKSEGSIIEEVSENSNEEVSSNIQLEEATQDTNEEDDSKAFVAYVTEEVQENEKEAYSFTEVSETLYAIQKANVRDIPDKSGSVIGSLSANQEVYVTGICDQTKWYRIVQGGTSAYVSDSLLTKEKKVEAAQEQSTKNTEVEPSIVKETPVVNNTPSNSGVTYIGNITNKKLHRADCKGRLPKESNRQYFDTLDAAIAAGYTESEQCKNCHPFR